ncbi:MULTISPECIES: hypothetical protein [Bacillaceae]|uniref:hypothetical protein n=1 Tax=Bacillaceae TaxID=186817 RepID=UPI0016523277|nr:MULTISPECIES: hypothetical protein [Bacillaceae]
MNIKIEDREIISLSFLLFHLGLRFLAVKNDHCHTILFDIILVQFINRRIELK